MPQTYQARRRGQDAPAAKEFQTSVPGPSLQELAAGAQPSTAQMGHRVDLPEAIRMKMEASFGADFSGVKLYESQTVADAGANAMTMGSSVAFAPGRLDLSSTSGQALLGHELSHVVSQAKGESAGRGFLADSGLEAQADRQGAMAARGESVYSGPVSPLSASAVPASAAGPMQAEKEKTKNARADKAAAVVKGKIQRRADDYNAAHPGANKTVSDLSWFDVAQSGFRGQGTVQKDDPTREFNQWLQKQMGGKDSIIKMVETAQAKGVDPRTAIQQRMEKSGAKKYLDRFAQGALEGTSLSEEDRSTLVMNNFMNRVISPAFTGKALEISKNGTKELSDKESDRVRQLNQQGIQLQKLAKTTATGEITSDEPGKEVSQAKKDFMHMLVKRPEEG